VQDATTVLLTTG
nr:immunoglobulin heavy chain junction region [Mus musculus]